MFYASGSNEHGQLSTGDYQSLLGLRSVNISIHHYRQQQYRKVGASSLLEIIDESKVFNSCKIKQIACGKRHTLILTTENDLYSCGDNSLTQLGVFETISNNTVEWIDFEPARKHKIKSIAASSSASFVFLENGDIYKTNSTKVNNTQKHSFTKVALENANTKDVKLFYSSPTTSRYYFITKDDKIFTSDHEDFGLYLTQHESILKGTIYLSIKNPIKIIACGGFHTIIITEMNEFYSLGGNFYYQRGDMDTNTTIREGVDLPFKGKAITQVTCGHFHTMVLLSNGELYACGKNTNGQLGLGHFQTKNLFTKVPLNSSIYTIHCGTDHTVILTMERRLLRCGRNDRGQLFMEYNKKDQLRFEVLPCKEFSHVSCGAHFTICYGDLQYVLNRLPRIGTFLKRKEFSDINFIVE
ncbi:hypothetical protein ABK040_008279 [Willaertia magna]